MSDSRDPKDCSLPGSSVHGIFQARVLEWGAIAFSSKWLQEKVKQSVKKRFFLFIPGYLVNAEENLWPWFYEDPPVI